MKRKITMCCRCFLYGVKAESVSPLFLYCKVTEQLRRIFFNFKGISWITPRKIMEALQIWEETGSKAKNKSRWRIVHTCIWWTTQKERNSRCFQNTEKSMQKIKLNCLLLLCFWSKQIYLDGTDSIVDVLESIQRQISLASGVQL